MNLSRRPLLPSAFCLLLSSPLFAAIDLSREIEAARAQNNLPALSVAVVNSQGLVAHGAAGVDTNAASDDAQKAVGKILKAMLVRFAAAPPPRS